MGRFFAECSDRFCIVKKDKASTTSSKDEEKTAPPSTDLATKDDHSPDNKPTTLSPKLSHSNKQKTIKPEKCETADANFYQKDQKIILKSKQGTIINLQCIR